jgi:hypothetical protein
MNSSTSSERQPWTAIVFPQPLSKSRCCGTGLPPARISHVTASPSRSRRDGQCSRVGLGKLALWLGIQMVKLGRRGNLASRRLFLAVKHHLAHGTL